MLTWLLFVSGMKLGVERQHGWNKSSGYFLFSMSEHESFFTVLRAEDVMNKVK